MSKIELKQPFHEEKEEEEEEEEDQQRLIIKSSQKLQQMTAKEAEKKGKDEMINPWLTYTSAQKKQSIFLLIGTMFYKFGYETLNNGLAQYVLSRYDTSLNVSTLAGLVIIFGFSQSLFSLFVSPFTARFRASTIAACTFMVAALVISALMILEALTGGKTVHELGTFPIDLIYVFYIILGGCVGIIEVTRKLIPRFILDDNYHKLKALNGYIHIFYEVAGTLGAFLSTAMIKYLGPIFGLVHLPPLFFVASILFFLVKHPFVESNQKKSQSFKERLCSAYTFTIGYLKGIKEGFTITTFDRRYNWLLLCFVLPQVLHRLIENLLFPVFSREVLGDGTLSGIILGGSNFGELLGAAFVVFASRYVFFRNPMVFVRSDAFFLTFVWAFYGLGLLDGRLSSIAIACMLMVVMIFVSGSWAAGDVSLLSYIQSSLSASTKANVHLDDEDADPEDGSPLASVLCYFYACFAILTTFVNFGFGKAINDFKDKGQTLMGFFWIGGVCLSCLGLLVFLSSLLAKKEYFSIATPQEKAFAEQQATRFQANVVEKRESLEETQAVSN